MSWKSDFFSRCRLLKILPRVPSVKEIKPLSDAFWCWCEVVVVGGGRVFPYAGLSCVCPYLTDAPVVVCISSF